MTSPFKASIKLDDIHFVLRISLVQELNQRSFDLSLLVKVWFILDDLESTCDAFFMIEDLDHNAKSSSAHLFHDLVSEIYEVRLLVLKFLLLFKDGINGLVVTLLEMLDISVIYRFSLDYLSLLLSS